MRKRHSAVRGGKADRNQRLPCASSTVDPSHTETWTVHDSGTNLRGAVKYRGQSRPCVSLRITVRTLAPSPMYVPGMEWGHALRLSVHRGAAFSLQDRYPPEREFAVSGCKA